MGGIVRAHTRKFAEIARLLGYGRPPRRPVKRVRSSPPRGGPSDGGNASGRGEGAWVHSVCRNSVQQGFGEAGVERAQA